MQSSPTSQPASLYQRLGSFDGIVKLVDDIIDEHMNNPVIKARFLPYREDLPRLAELKGHLVRFLAAGSGGPEEYTGRTMVDAHRGMNISDGEYMAAIDDLMAVLRRHDIDDQTQKDVLAIAYSLKSEIVAR